MSTNELDKAYFQHVALIEAFRMVRCFCDQIPNDDISTKLLEYERKIGKTLPDHPHSSDFNPFGGPQMLPPNWRNIAHSRDDFFNGHEANGYSPDFIELCKKIGARLF